MKNNTNQQQLIDKVNELAPKVADVLDGHRCDIVQITLLHLLEQEIEKYMPSSEFLHVIKSFKAGFWRGILLNQELERIIEMAYEYCWGIEGSADLRDEWHKLVKKIYEEKKETK